MLTPIHLCIVFPGLKQRPSAGGELPKVFAIAGHVVTADLVYFMVAVGLGAGVYEVVIHIACE